jgi:hypothetical protein
MAGPVLYYPLTNSSVDSWPVRSFSGVAAGQAVWAEDASFPNASVLVCGPGKHQHAVWVDVWVVNGRIRRVRAAGGDDKEGRCQENMVTCLVTLRLI